IQHAIEEGVKFKFLTNPVKYIGNKNGFVKAMEVISMELGEEDKSGRRSPIPITGSNMIMDIDLVLIAIGAGPNPILFDSTPDLKLNKWGYIDTTDESGKTYKDKVWAGGDIVTGAATVISAMGAGKKAAYAINEYLKKS
ncbi:TPA: dihydropyrimidine dehydrogenase, partial [candidate division WOR-3 bacterium]|nr:dihydropyrimidine dehydrogenase [candidate division WOR-3 bacterium]